MMRKRCYRCKEKKDIILFSRNRCRKDGFADQCKACQREYILTYARTPIDKKNKLLGNYYGVSSQFYTTLYKQQCGVCSICGKPESATSSKGNAIALSVDHDHETGKTRGLLCHKCNRGLGLFRDNIDVLASAISYLQQPHVI